MKKSIRIILLLILVLGIFAFKSVYQSGAFKTIVNSFSGTTRQVDGIVGAEDITIDQSTGIAFISSDDRWATKIYKKPVKGAIYSLNLNDSTSKPVNLTLDLDQQDFHPHGISLYQTPQGKKILFVVNHRNDGNVIERFEYRNDSLILIESIPDDLIISPNDIIGVGERSFYITNDHNEKLSTWRYVKDLLAIGNGNVCYFDGEKMTITSIEGMKYANGIAVSLDGKKLYLTSTTGKCLYIYDRDIPSGKLVEVARMDNGTGVDNIEMDTKGDLWIGCHPQMLKFITHSKNEDACSPSEIIKLTNLGNDKFRQETIYMNNGKEISASSVGAVYKDLLVIGPVFQRHITIGKMK
ncbi:MAG: hypothetical protein HOP08_03430 [Cyclobacteriaceae bacterium]|nr:hypothetical protein [Cyclobacteriaceae bacterium]